MKRKKQRVMTGDEFRDLRIKSGLTQIELAAIFRLSVRSISRFENRRKVDGMAELALLCIARRCRKRAA